MKFQVVHRYTGRHLFSGSAEECQQWIADYGLGVSVFDVLPFRESRDCMDIIDTY